MPVPYPETTSGVELSLLKHLFSPKEAEAALCLSAIAEPLDTIYKRAKELGFSREELESILDGLVKKGAIMSPPTSGEKIYGKLPLVIGMFEFQVNNLKKEFMDDFHQYLDETFRDKILPPERTKQMRTIPIGETLPTERAVGTYDDIREIVENAKGPFAVANCVCRQSKDLAGEPCKVTEERELCLMIGNGARMYVRDGRGRRITREEFLEKIDAAQEAGMVLQPENSQNPSFICCCCGCCCEMIQNAKKLPVPSQAFHSNFFAEVSPEACKGCETCVNRCQMEAIEIQNKKAQIDYHHCIGCGVCVNACPENAIQLQLKQKVTKPPRDFQALYKQLLSERLGFLGTLTLMGKMLLKRKI
jgi:Pyruvate/2-oxoacid:ferredoxin oxidoreductase delta subunit